MCIRDRSVHEVCMKCAWKCAKSVHESVQKVCMKVCKKCAWKCSKNAVNVCKKLCNKVCHSELDSVLAFFQKVCKKCAKSMQKSVHQSVQNNTLLLSKENLETCSMNTFRLRPTIFKNLQNCKTGQSWCIWHASAMESSEVCGCRLVRFGQAPPEDHSYSVPLLSPRL